jgi:hypothetical protein
MSKAKKSSGKKAQVLALLKELETKGNAGNSLKETGKSLIVGALGAGLGVAIGRPSLLVGLATAFTGHYFKNNRITSLGIGMMASGGYAVGQGLKGADVGGLEGVKERLKTFGENIKERLYIDKFIKPKTNATDDGTAGLGDVQYFKYPGGSELNMGSLDDIENEITRKSEEFERRQMSGGDDDISGLEDRIY